MSLNYKAGLKLELRKIGSCRCTCMWLLPCYTYCMYVVTTLLYRVTLYFIFANFVQFYYYYSVLRPFKDYFSSYETNQSGRRGKSKNGRSTRKTTWHTGKQTLACLTCGQCGAQTHTRQCGEMTM